MDRDKIKPQRTYRTEGGRLLYVHDLSEQKVIYCDVGSIDRHKCSLGRFASRIVSEAPNQ